MGENNKIYPWKIHKPADVIFDTEADPVEYASLKPGRIPLEKRLKSFAEVEQVFSSEMAIKEAKRCLRCELEVELLKEP